MTNPYASPKREDNLRSNDRHDGCWLGAIKPMTWFTGGWAIGLLCIFIGPFLVMLTTGDMFPLGATIICMFAALAFFVFGTVAAIVSALCSRKTTQKAEGEGLNNSAEPVRSKKSAER